MDIHEKMKTVADEICKFCGQQVKKGAKFSDYHDEYQGLNDKVLQIGIEAGCGSTVCPDDLDKWRDKQMKKLYDFEDKIKSL